MVLFARELPGPGFASIEGQSGIRRLPRFRLRFSFGDDGGRDALNDGCHVRGACGAWSRFGIGLRAPYRHGRAVAPLGLGSFLSSIPWADAHGYMRSPRWGWGVTVLRRRIEDVLVRSAESQG